MLTSITGILRYLNGNIIQVLEEAELCVRTLYVAICHDLRPTQVITVYDYLIEKQSFSDRPMGFKTISTSQLAYLKKPL